MKATTVTKPVASAMLLGQRRSDCISSSLFDFFIIFLLLSHHRRPFHFPSHTACLLWLCFAHGSHPPQEAVSVALHGTLIRMLMAVSSAKGSWYWWLLLPNIFMSMLRYVSSWMSSDSFDCTFGTMGWWFQTERNKKRPLRQRFCRFGIHLTQWAHALSGWLIFKARILKFQKHFARFDQPYR